MSSQMHGGERDQLAGDDEGRLGRGPGPAEKDECSHGGARRPRRRPGRATASWAASRVKTKTPNASTIASFSVV